MTKQRRERKKPNIQLVPKDKKLKKDKNICAFLDLMSDEISRELTADKLADMFIGFPYKISIEEGKISVKVIKDFYERNP